MTKDQKNTVTEYASCLSEEDLRWLGLRLTERLAGDLADTLDFMSQTTKIDEIFQSANSSNELYDLCDRVREVITKECKKRGVILKWTP